jgi:hypothetical protein
MAPRTVELFRFHSRPYFWPQPQSFFRNFLETTRTFQQQARFAGHRINSGFYFGTSAEVSVAEALWYLHGRSSDPLDPEAALSELSRAGHDAVFLRCAVDLDSLIDITNPKVLSQKLRDGALRMRTLRESPFVVAWLAQILSDRRGGNEVTDALGHDLHDEHPGVIFPSVRALQSALPHLPALDLRVSLDSISRAWASDPMGIAEMALIQLQSETNVAFFSGSRLTRTIREYSWLTPAGGWRTESNPWYGVDQSTLERARLDERKRLGLAYDEALSAGLLADVEIEVEFEDRWIFRARTKPT